MENSGHFGPLANIKVFGQNQGKRTISRFLAKPDEEASGPSSSGFAKNLDNCPFSLILAKNLDFSQIP